MTRAILDTSVFIAREQDRGLSRQLPDEVAVSVVSVAELELGVLMAADPITRARRLGTLTAVRSIGAALPIDERTASAYALLASTVIAAGRRPRVHDTWIAASALVSNAEVWTQDGDFTDFATLVTVVAV